MEEKVIEILSDLVADFDPEEKALIDDGIMSSLDVLQVLVAIQDEFEVSIPASAIKPQNFNSVDNIVELIGKVEQGLI